MFLKSKSNKREKSKKYEKNENVINNEITNNKQKNYCSYKTKQRDSTKIPFPLNQYAFHNVHY